MLYSGYGVILTLLCTERSGLLEAFGVFNWSILSISHIALGSPRVSWSALLPENSLIFDLLFIKVNDLIN